MYKPAYVYALTTVFTFAHRFYTSGNITAMVVACSGYLSLCIGVILHCYHHHCYAEEKPFK